MEGERSVAFSFQPINSGPDVGSPDPWTGRLQGDHAWLALVLSDLADCWSHWGLPWNLWDSQESLVTPVALKSISTFQNFSDLALGLVAGARHPYILKAQMKSLFSLCHHPYELTHHWSPVIHQTSVPWEFAYTGFLWSSWSFFCHPCSWDSWLVGWERISTWRAFLCPTPGFLAWRGAGNWSTLQSKWT